MNSSASVPIHLVMGALERLVFPGQYRRTATWHMYALAAHRLIDKRNASKHVQVVEMKMNVQMLSTAVCLHPVLKPPTLLSRHKRYPSQDLVCSIAKSRESLSYSRLWCMGESGTDVAPFDVGEYDMCVGIVRLNQ